MGMGRDAVELKTAGAWKSVVAEQWSAVLRRWQVLRGAPETWEAPRLIPCRGLTRTSSLQPRLGPETPLRGRGRERSHLRCRSILSIEVPSLSK
jgi:hypothetical protein